jgi:ATP-dependent 26S proteasome regulatory subunit
LELLDRNVLNFVARRHRLHEFRMPTKKGLLFYGPPGTGKTHTIRYLVSSLKDHTTFLISSEQVGLLGEYMTLARLLQPSMVVMEDVDLLARERTQMRSASTELLLNKLLNEMDGLREDAEILFILTTNRPEELETALASRPGRIDQAIEFPFPDTSGREKLVRLYSQGLTLSDELTVNIVQRTENVSASFIKELMRRAAQFNIEREGGGMLIIDDVTNALDEMLFSGGSLNLKLLGAESRLNGDLISE